MTDTAVLPRRMPTGESIDALDGLLRLCETLVPTGFLPNAIKTPGQALAIILAGKELGLAPMQSLRSLRLVQGNVTIAADLLLAAFKAAGGKADWPLDTPEAVKLHLVHVNGDEYVSPFTMNDAKRAGLSGKENWQKYPQAMLRARAITAGLKAIGWQPAAGVYDSTSDEIPEPVGVLQVGDQTIHVRGSLTPGTPPLGESSVGAYGREIDLEGEFQHAQLRVEQLLEDPNLPSEYKAMAQARIARKPLTRKSAPELVAALEQKILEAVSAPKGGSAIMPQNGGELALEGETFRARSDRVAQAAGL